MSEGQVPDVHSIRTYLLRLTEAQSDESNFLECSRERETAYDEKSAARWWEALQFYRDTGRSSPSVRILDVGTSPFTFLLRDLFSEVATLDLTDHFRRRCEDADISFHDGGLAGDSSTIPDDHFDCIFCLEVLEHLHLNPVSVMRMLHRKLAAGGVLILSTPNMATLGNRTRLMLNRKLVFFSYPPFQDNPHEVHGHVHDRLYMPPELREYALQAGFGRAALRYHLHYPPLSSFELRNPARWPGLLIRAAIPSTRLVVVLVAQK